MGKRNDEEVVLSRLVTEDGYVQVYLNNKPVELYVLMQRTANVGTPINGYTELEDKIIAKLLLTLFLMLPLHNDKS